ncbi:dorsal-ventral patterning protein tolloid-like isoform X1 [Cotesia glomerata]|nr:dorsal-ventral patterning protein tolloid-like isoform X1 [Cotesia glomerata]
MHYPSDAFSIYWPLETLLPKQKNLSLGTNIKLSEGDISTANMLNSCPKCGGIFYGISGSFGPSTHSSNSIQMKNCKWRIKASKGERIELVIPTLRIFQNPNCTDEFLEIRTGYPPHSTVLSRYCGNFSSISIKTNNVLFVTYVKATTSNPSIGFTAHYNITCGGIFDIKLNTPFNLESTNFPDAYPLSRRCTWKFTAPNNHRIAMKIHYFELELYDSCIDFLMSKDGIDYNSKIIGVYCGKRDSWQINSTDNKLLVDFSSDRMINYSGFSATLFAIPLDG